MTLNIPVIDLQRLEAGEDHARLAEVCAAWGFFQLVGHGIGADEAARMLAFMRQFFDQPMAQKQALSRTAENPWGYFDRELTKNRRDWKEIFDLGVDQSDPRYVSRAQWPELAGFRDTVLAWYGICDGLSQRLLAQIIATLGVPSAPVVAEFSQPNSSFLRLNHYPPCAQPDAHLGISNHSDAGAVTLLLTDKVAGLQVDFGGQWVTVMPEPGALVVNIGDLVEIWSNARFKAPEHRVLAGSQHRYSAAFFLNPRFDTVVAPLGKAVEPVFRPLNWGEFRAGRAAGDFADYGTEVQITDYRI